MTTTSLTVTPLSNRIGAQIDGVDLTDLDGAEFTAIDEALMRYQVVFLRGQELTADSQAAFGEWDQSRKKGRSPSMVQRRMRRCCG